MSNAHAEHLNARTSSLPVGESPPGKDPVKVFDHHTQCLETMAKDLQSHDWSLPLDPQESESDQKLELSTFDGTAQDPLTAMSWFFETEEKLY